MELGSFAKAMAREAGLVHSDLPFLHLLNLAFVEFPTCPDRAMVAREIAQWRLLADRCNVGHVAQPVCGALVSSLKMNCPTAAVIHARNLLRSPHQGFVDSQRLVWLVLTEYPLVIPFSMAPDLAALRILPDHIGGSETSRAALEQHIISLAESWAQSTDDVEWIHANKSTPLCRVEGGYFFYHLMCQRTTPPVDTSTLSLIAQCTANPNDFM